jgi:hypothetical protein
MQGVSGPTEPRGNLARGTVEVVPPQLRTLLSRLREADARRSLAPFGSAERRAAEEEVEALMRAIRGEAPAVGPSGPETRSGRPPDGERPERREASD